MRGKDVFIVQSGGGKVNDNLMELVGARARTLIMGLMFSVVDLHFRMPDGLRKAHHCRAPSLPVLSTE